MDTVWFIILAIILTLGTITIGVIRNRRFKAIEDLHVSLGKRLDLDIAFASPVSYTLFGSHRGYSIKVQPQNLAIPGDKKPKWFTKVGIPMVNPVRKMLRISRRSPQFTELENLVQVARVDSVSHDLEPWLDIQTNDLMFASIILSENVKISIHQVFHQLISGLLYIEDDEIALVIPGLLRSDEELKLAYLAAQTLCDMKDELNS